MVKLVGTDADVEFLGSLKAASIIEFLSSIVDHTRKCNLSETRHSTPQSIKPQRHIHHNNHHHRYHNSQYSKRFQTDYFPDAWSFARTITMYWLPSRRTVSKTNVMFQL